MVREVRARQFALASSAFCSFSSSMGKIALPMELVYAARLFADLDVIADGLMRQRHDPGR